MKKFNLPAAMKQNLFKSKKPKKLSPELPSFATNYKAAKGFGTLPEPEKKKIKLSKFTSILRKGKK
jgi:hypothetical protein